MDIIALTSVICSAMVSVYTIYSNRKSLQEIEKLKENHDIELLNYKKKLSHDDERKQIRYKLEEEMLRCASEIDSGKKEREPDLLRLLIQYRLTIDGDKDMIDRHIESFCCSDYFHSNQDRYCETSAIQDILIYADECDTKTSCKCIDVQSFQKEKKSLTARILPAIRSGWQAFRESLS